MKLFVLFLSLAAAAVPGVAADDAPLSGKWQIHTSIADREADMSCTFTQAGKELKGECATEQGKVQISGTVEEKKAAWSYKIEYNGSPLTVSFAGTLDGGKISGSMTAVEYNVEGGFTAKPDK